MPPCSQLCSPAASPILTLVWLSPCVCVCIFACLCKLCLPLANLCHFSSDNSVEWWCICLHYYPPIPVSPSVFYLYDVYCWALADHRRRAHEHFQRSQMRNSPSKTSTAPAQQTQHVSQFFIMDVADSRGRDKWTRQISRSQWTLQMWKIWGGTGNGRYIFLKGHF